MANIYCLQSSVYSTFPRRLQGGDYPGQTGWQTHPSVSPVAVVRVIGLYVNAVMWSTLTNQYLPDHIWQRINEQCFAVSYSDYALMSHLERETTTGRRAETNAEVVYWSTCYCTCELSH